MLDETMDDINLIRYYIVVNIQIYIFNQLDEGNENILKYCRGIDYTSLENNDGTYLGIANAAMHCNKIRKMILLLFQLKGFNNEQLMREMFEDYYRHTSQLIEQR